MTIDNRKNIIKGKLFRFVLGIIILALATLIALHKLVFPEAGLTKHVMFIIVLGSYLIYYLIFMVRDVSYIFIERKPSVITIKYASLLPWGKRQSFAIKSELFYKVTIESKFLGLKQLVVFYQKSPQGILKYPPISITGLSKKDKERIKNELAK